ncbi:MAG: hypothetical protein IJ111_13615 [Eggerthellaceae bacterium]|nr:hypothetical protein [Eggerthellaceae bacterium]
MLSPDDLSRAGEEVAAVYRQIEDSMVDALAGLLVSGETRTQTFETAMQLLSQSAVPRIHGVMERNRVHIDEATRSEVGRWLALSDSDDLSRIKAALGVELPGITAREAASVVEGVAGILSRDNLEMERGAAQAFLRHSTWAVTQVSSGAMTMHSAWREAAVRLAGEGITHVTYRDTASGRVTVTNHADVAVRRHIRSQLSQATMSRTLQVCREAGIGFVEVSSHTGARPTHAEWHGRVYSLDGDVTVDGRLYKDFWRGTGYQGKEGPYASLGDRLGGVNCRHAFGPWLPGTPRAYDPDPPHPSGLPNDEVYELTQKQRAQERRIRATKRELMVARGHAEPGNLEDSVRVARLEKKLKHQQAGMRKLVDDANASGNARVLARAYPRESVVGYKPGGAIKASGRTLDEFMAMPGVEAARKRVGLTKAEFRRGMRAELEKRGLGVRDFRDVEVAAQRELQDAVLSSAGRRAETKVKRHVADATKLETAEGIAMRDSQKLQKAFKPETAARLGCAVEESILSGDATRANAARVFARTVEGEAKYRRVRNITTARYVPTRREIQIPVIKGPDGKNLPRERYDLPEKVVVHETLHLEDYQGSVNFGIDGSLRTSTRQFSSHQFTTGDGYIRTHLAEDWADIEQAAVAAGKTVDDFLLDGLAEYGIGGQDAGPRSFFSDFVDAASNGAVSFGYSHTGERPGYWLERGGANIGTECIANYGGSAVANPVEYEAIKRFFPRASGTLDKLLEAMANA